MPGISFIHRNLAFAIAIHKHIETLKRRHSLCECISAISIAAGVSIAYASVFVNDDDDDFFRSFSFFLVIYFSYGAIQMLSIKWYFGCMFLFTATYSFAFKGYIWFRHFSLSHLWGNEFVLLCYHAYCETFMVLFRAMPQYIAGTFHGLPFSWLS